MWWLALLAACGGAVDTGPTVLGTLEIGEVPEGEGVDGFRNHFEKYGSVFGVHFFATEGVPNDKVLHGLAVLAQYLDNDEDGEADDAAVVEAMVSEGAGMVMFATDREARWSSLWRSDLPESHVLQDLYGEETHPGGSSVQAGFDATLEEVLHLVSSTGVSGAYPEAFGMDDDSELAEAMDLARGGHFDEVPDAYPDDAWYHYDDTTCDYYCMQVEYFYWALTSWLGAQDYSGRCQDIAVEWEPCTPDKVESMDPAVHAMLTNPDYGLPTAIPDGVYRAE